MLAKTSAGGLCTAFPDVCLTPAPPAPSPIPVPYPNLGVEPTDTTFVPNVLITCAPAHNMATMPMMTNGDRIASVLYEEYRPIRISFHAWPHGP